MDDMAKDVRNMTCCFTGHRYLPMSEKMEVADRLEKTVTGLIRAGVRYFGAGGAVGFDTLAAKTILRQREEYPHTHSEAVRIGRALSKNTNLAAFGKTITTFRLFSGTTVEVEDYRPKGGRMR